MPYAAGHTEDAMSKSKHNPKCDIVGSFLRPEEVKRARASFKAGDISLAELREVEDDAIADLVAQQVEHGLTVVTDGEFRRRWWHLDWLTRVDAGAREQA